MVTYYLHVVLREPNHAIKLFKSAKEPPGD